MMLVEMLIFDGNERSGYPGRRLSKRSIRLVPSSNLGVEARGEIGGGRCDVPGPGETSSRYYAEEDRPQGQPTTPLVPQQNQLTPHCSKGRDGMKPKGESPRLVLPP